MRKLLHILMLSALFVSCSSDENRIIDDGGNSMIDEKIIGKWRVEYAKNIYIEQFYKIFEYNGKYNGNENSIPQAGFFTRKEISIEFNKEGQLLINYVDKQPFSTIKEETITTTYNITNDSIQLTGNYPLKAKYYINSNNELIIENSYYIMKDDPQYNPDILIEKEGVVYSKYSKITK